MHSDDTTEGPATRIDASHNAVFSRLKSFANLAARLPLVSVIVVNYNYGRFLREAVTSVFAQTYPNIECVIVDNASTDESSDVLDEIEREYSEAIILRRKDNGGASLAAIEGFEASKGQYVVFLDADDFLLPSFVETHVFVHLSLRVAVGFTSSDMLHIVSGEVVTATYSSLSHFVRSGRGKRSNLMRRIDENAPEVWSLSDPLPSIENLIHLVEPGVIQGWVWAPTSSNCFRRDALLLFLNNARLGSLRFNTDAYLLPGISALVGSVVIDRPLAAYRLHGENVFSKHPPLNNLLNFEKGVPTNLTGLARKMIIDHLIENAQYFMGKLDSPHKFAEALKALDDDWILSPSIVPRGRSYVGGKLISEWRTVAPLLGDFNCVILLLQLGMGPRAVLRAILATAF